MKIIRVWFRCAECGFRVPVSGPSTVDFQTCRPIVCGKCRGHREFVQEEEAA